jgi:NADH-dependent peroxiredoxin subunit F
MFDLIIIGLGPGGVAAAVYAGRKKLKTLILGKDIGGQSVASQEIYNWIGIPKISGADMAMALDEQLEMVADSVQAEYGQLVTEIIPGEQEHKKFFTVKTDQGQEYSAKAIIIASGAGRRKLNVPGEAEYNGRGVFYCSICDAPLLKGQKAVVVGGGNAGLEAVIDLLPYAEEIYLLEVIDALRADAVTQEKILNNPKVKILLNSQVKEVKGEKKVNAVVYEDLKTGQITELEVGGIFVQIGSVPNSQFAKNLIQTDEIGQIVVDPTCGKTSLEGIWAAGDVTNLPYKQNNTAIGDAVRAFLNLYDYLITQK